MSISAVLAFWPLISGFLPNAQAASISTAGESAGPDGGAATPGVAGVVFNPALLAVTPGFQAMLDAQASAIRLEVTADRNGGIDPNTGAPYKPSTAKVVVPNAILGASWQVVPDRLGFGLAVYDPFVGGGDYTSTESGDTPPYTGAQRYHIINTKIITLAVEPAVGVTVVDGLHVGAGVAYVKDILQVLQASDPLGTEGILSEQLGMEVPDDPYALDTYLSGSTSGSHVAWNAGVFFNRWEKLQVGLSYAGPSTFHAEGEGEVDVPQDLSTEEGGVVVPANLAIEFKLPSVLRFNVVSALDDRWTVGAGVELQQWYSCCNSQDGDISIQVTNQDGNAIGPDDGVTIEIDKQQYNPRRLWDAGDFIAHVGWQTNDKLWLGLRSGYNAHAVPDYAVSPSNLDFDNVFGMVGARYRAGEHVVLGLAYTKYFLMTRTIKDSAWDLRDGNERFSPELPYKAGTNGTYSGQVDGLGLRLGVEI